MCVCYFFGSWLDDEEKRDITADAEGFIFTVNMAKEG